METRIPDTSVDFSSISLLKNQTKLNQVKRHLEPEHVSIISSGTLPRLTWDLPGNYNIIVECYPGVSELYMGNGYRNYIILIGKRDLTGYTWLRFEISI